MSGGSSARFRSTWRNKRIVQGAGIGIVFLSDRHEQCPMVVEAREVQLLGFRPADVRDIADADHSSAIRMDHHIAECGKTAIGAASIDVVNA
ncbi:MAG: hypothetical protein WC804_21535 [Sphingomonas sp.]|jgi:hypothetical protein|uniref:hypothetical protein n=1 Tax=Sphingomonas sp. TaxID=28214 RepID=UPI0035640548